MPTFKVLRRVDAFVDYIAEVEARTAAEAARALLSGRRLPGIEAMRARR